MGTGRVDRIPHYCQIVLATGIALLLTVGPFLQYRQRHHFAKRFREVSAEKVYRSGVMTADGFREALNRHKIKTVINLMEEAPDPDLPNHYFGGGMVRESELCQSHGARMIFVFVDLVPRNRLSTTRPKTIEKFLEIMDDPANYPVLIHCKAGLHRTGVLTAVYRMEYDGWSRDRALQELKANGFGDSAAHSANDYIIQYVLSYKPGIRNPATHSDS